MGHTAIKAEGSQRTANCQILGRKGPHSSTGKNNNHYYFFPKKINKPRKKEREREKII